MFQHWFNKKYDERFNWRVEDAITARMRKHLDSKHPTPEFTGATCPSEGCRGRLVPAYERQDGRLYYTCNDQVVGEVGVLGDWMHHRYKGCGRTFWVELQAEERRKSTPAPGTGAPEQGPSTTEEKP